MLKSRLINELKRYLPELELQVGDNQAEKLIDYLLLLEKWNKAINLTSVRDVEQMLTVHLLDSLSVNAFITGATVDVGTGGGLPGMPLAIINPELQFTLVDTNSKKTAFLTQCINDLAIENVTVVTARIEEYIPESLFDTVISRAFSSIEKYHTFCQHLRKPSGKMLIMKSQGVDEELKQLSPEFPTTKTINLTVPGLERMRSLVEL